MNIIEISNLSYQYSQNEDFIKNLSLNIEEGSYVSIVGHNGSGKSTLAKLLIGFLTPKEGTIIIDGEELNKKNINAIRQKISMVFQNPDNQFIASTVQEDVAFGLENRLVPQKEMQPLIDEFVKYVGMEDYLNEEPSNLSGGQKQRVAIAGALVINPKILILDEATSMLDPKGKKEIYQLIHEMKAKNPSLTIVSITHDVDEAFFSDRLIVMSKGEIVLDDSPYNIFKDKDVATYTLDLPFTYRFVKKLKEAGIAVDFDMNFNEIVEAICQ